MNAPDPRFDLYEKLLPLLDKDIDELFEVDKHVFLLTIQDMIKNAKKSMVDNGQETATS